MKHIFTIIFIIIQFSVSAQIRYLDSLFVAERTHKKLAYGKAAAINFPYLSEKFTRKKTLVATVYQPKKDTLNYRPCVIVAHGGGFVGGSRKQKNINKASKYLAEKGYVVFNIDYRTGYNPLRSMSAERAVYRGIQDMKAAIRFAKANAESFRIDTNLVFAMGTSAGSMMAIHAAYFDENERVNIPTTYEKRDLNCLSCSGNNFKHSDKPIAVANLWGAFIDTIFIGKNNADIPMISFHGTKDKIVFADEKSPIRSPFFKAVSGSNVLTPRLKNLGMTTHYHPFVNKGHEPWGILRTKPEFDTIMNKTAVFFFDVLMNYYETANSQSENIKIEIINNLETKATIIHIHQPKNCLINYLIINELGEVVSSKTLSQTAANKLLKVPVNYLPKGNYYLIINTEEKPIFCQFFTL